MLIFQKRHGEIFSYYRILISRRRCNFWQSLNKFCKWGSEPPWIFENLRWLSCICVSHMTNYVNFKRSKDVEKNPGPTQYNTDHHEVIIRPFMQNHNSTMQLTSPISSENLMQSRLGELGLQSIDFGGQVIVSLDLYHINYMAIATIICVYVLLGETIKLCDFFVSDCELRQY